MTINHSGVGPNFLVAVTTVATATTITATTPRAAARAAARAATSTVGGVMVTFLTLDVLQDHRSMIDLFLSITTTLVLVQVVTISAVTMLIITVLLSAI